MLDLALTQVEDWREAGLRPPRRREHDGGRSAGHDFPAEVAATLDAHGLPPEALVLEVTENMVLADPVRVGDVLAQLGELGLGLSLDDFGTGFSSLTHLKSLPVGEVKIDRSFVGRMTSDPVDAAIVEATIQLAHSIGIRVVAEGIEDQVTWSSLVANRCELVQGYALSRPLPAAELEELLRAKPVPTAPAAHRTSAGAGHARPRRTQRQRQRQRRDGRASRGAPDTGPRAPPEALRDLTALTRSHPMMDAVIEEVDGRMIRVGSQWLADFASCNYLGFDLDREIIDAVPAYLDAWGTHPSWSRLLGSPALYEQIEERLTALLGSADSLVLPTITHIHISVIPVLAGVGDDLPRLARAQDDLRRLPDGASARRDRRALPLRGSRAPGRAAAGASRRARGWCAWTGSTA